MSNTNLESLSQKLKSGSLVLFDYIAEILQHIEITEPIIHALIPEPGRKQRLFQAAEVLLTKYPDPATRPPLFGVLIGIKDLFNVDGLPTQAGSKLPPAAFAGKEAEVVTQLKNLGAIILGKTVSTEFAYFSPGPTCNPINPSHTPGGSSSGSAAAVAAGYCSFALGTQTIASIIRPASYCGVVGFKPSYGRATLQGIFPFNPLMDHPGIICQRLDDLNVLAPILLDTWIPVSVTRPPRIGIPHTNYLKRAKPAALADFDKRVKELRDQGLELIQTGIFEDIDALEKENHSVCSRGFHDSHVSLWEHYNSIYSTRSTVYFLQGSKVNDKVYSKCQITLAGRRERIVTTFANYGIDLLISPSTTESAPRGFNGTGSPLMSLPFTHHGLPSLTIPSGNDTNGLPFGLQIAAAPGMDEYLVLAASALRP